MQPATGLAFFISRKGGLTLADDKKNIGPEVEKTDAPPAPDQPAHGKVEPVVADPAPAEKAAPWIKRSPPSRRFPALRLPSRPSPTRRPERTRHRLNRKPRSRRIKQRPRPARAVRQRLTRRPPTRPSRPRETKCPKVRQPRKTLPPIRRRLRLLPHRNSPPRPVTPLDR